MKPILYFCFSSRRRHTSWNCDWSSDVCSSDLSRAGIHDAGSRIRLDREEGGEERARIAEVCTEAVRKRATRGFAPRDRRAAAHLSGFGRSAPLLRLDGVVVPATEAQTRG